MLIGTNFNLAASRGQRALAVQAQKIQNSVENLSSGTRINSAADDAAGLAVATHLTTGLHDSDQTIRNIMDGISYTQVADQALSTVQDYLQRARELVVSVATSVRTNRDATVTELMEITEEINHIASDTEIFGKTPFDADFYFDYSPYLDSTDPTSATADPTNSYSHIPRIYSMMGPDGETSMHASGLAPIAVIPAGTTGLELTIDTAGSDDDIQLFTSGGQHLIGTNINEVLQTDDDGNQLLDEDGNPILERGTDTTWQAQGITDSASAEATLLSTENGFSAGTGYDDSALFEADRGYFYSSSPDNYPASHSSSVNGMNITYSGDGEPYETVSIDTVTEDLMLFVVGNSNFLARTDWESIPFSSVSSPTMNAEGQAAYQAAWEDAHNTRVLIDAEGSEGPEFLNIKKTEFDTRSLGFGRLWLGDPASASESIELFDNAIAQISNDRAYYGATHSRLESALAGQQQYQIAASATRSRIMDTDYAEETSQLAKTQILQQATTAMLAQANSMPQLVLRLIG